MNVTASQIRQDFNNFGGFGQQGYGYNVEVLRREIGKILGLDKKYNVIILGAGNLGHALANYSGFARRGFLVSAIFDVDKEKVGQKVGELIVRDMTTLEEYIKENSIDIVALTLPKSKAPEVAKELVKMGIHAFWNFAATDLNLPENVVVENVHLAESLMRLSYNIANLPHD
ncbi:MAG: redox-sensing transcriptional repressor Rex, partial [Eubacterium sp.]|nr:redox-sensing transcriptional repressor Rex [Eubacterium sp.]